MKGRGYMVWLLAYSGMKIGTQRSVEAVRLSVLALLMIVLPFSSHGQANPRAKPGSKRHKLGPVNPKLYGPSVAQELDGGVWRTDGGFQAIFRISNKAQTAAIRVTPVLFMADGTEYALAPVNVKASGSATVNIND